MSKLDRLTTLRDSLLDCCKESVKNADEWQTFHDWLEKVKDMISDEHRQARLHGRLSDSERLGTGGTLRGHP